MTAPAMPAMTLDGLRVLEIGHFVAAPFCTRLLADLGADVIKIEPPTGDPVRQWGAMVDERSLWWSLHGRNKRCIALDLKTPQARELTLRLVAHCDVVVENFRPGQLDKFGLGPRVLREQRPDLVIAHISGYGQTGPYRERAAFGMIGEAIGGLRYLTNHPPGTTDLPPVRVGVSIGDSISGLYAAFGIMAALWRRKGNEIAPGSTVDVALTECVLSMMEGMLPEYGRLGRIKQPTGGAIATAAPTNAYPTRDRHWLLIGANSDPLFARLCALMDRHDLLESPDYRDNRNRTANAAALDASIAAWSEQHDIDALIALLNRHDIPNSKVFTAADCATDPQFRARAMLQEIEDPLLGGTVLHAGVVPHIPEAPGGIRWPGPRVGQHTGEVLTELLGLSSEQLEHLRVSGAIA